MRDLHGLCVYLSGPMSGLPDYNRRAFNGAASMLRTNGATTFNPADYFESLSELSHKRCMFVTLSELITETFDGDSLLYDLVVMLPGWESSEGAQVEHAVAEAIGIEVVELSELLADER